MVFPLPTDDGNNIDGADELYFTIQLEQYNLDQIVITDPTGLTKI